MNRTSRFLIGFLFLLAGCALKRLPLEMGNPKWGLDVSWHGQSCFTLRDSVGRTLVIDPFDETVGYGRLSLKADALLITHRHFDHDHARAVRSRLAQIELVESTGTSNVASGLMITGLQAYHDNENGQIHGPNLIYTFVMGGLRCVHVGDLGQHRLTPYQKKMIGAVDVLFVPIGGVTTLNAEQAKRLVDELKPGWVFPMHYGDIRFYKLETLDKFTDLFSPDKIERVDGATIRLRETDRNSSSQVIVLATKKKNN